jgi:hypothetical protein
MERDALVAQMAKAFSGQSMMDPSPTAEEQRRRAAEALARVEIFLGADIEEAKEILSRVAEDVT